MCAEYGGWNMRVRAAQVCSQRALVADDVESSLLTKRLRWTVYRTSMGATIDRHTEYRLDRRRVDWQGRRAVAGHQ